jgi:hypothetical protein
MHANVMHSRFSRRNHARKKKNEDMFKKKRDRYNSHLIAATGKAHPKTQQSKQHSTEQEEMHLRKCSGHIRVYDMCGV